jgi:hypothetical protein
MANTVLGHPSPAMFRSPLRKALAGVGSTASSALRMTTALIILSSPAIYVGTGLRARLQHQGSVDSLRAHGCFPLLACEA